MHRHQRWRPVIIGLGLPWRNRAAAVERRLHHYSAICHLATTLLTRNVACWRRDERYVIRDLDGRRITPTEGKAIVRARYRIPPQNRNRVRIPQETSGSTQ